MASRPSSYSANTARCHAARSPHAGDGWSGGRAIAIRGEFPDARLIALTTYGGDEDIRRALNAGVQAYLTKDVLHDELLKAIRAVHAGERYLPAAVAAALSAQVAAARI